MLTALEPVLVGLLTRATGDLGARLLRAATGMRGKLRQKDLNVAEHLLSYRITSHLNVEDLARAIPAEINTDDVIKHLAGNDYQALVHELLALRIVDSPDRRVIQLRNTFASLLASKLSLSDRATIDAASFCIWHFLDDACLEIVDAVLKQDTSTIDRIKTNANYALIRSTLDTIDRHIRSIAGNSATDHVSYTRFIDQYRAQVVTAHGSITPPDFDRRRRVPVDDLYVAPTFTSTAARGTDTEPSLDELRCSIDRTVILGDPGGGKSTLTSVLAYRNALEPDSRIPFVIIVRELPRNI